MDIVESVIYLALVANPGSAYITPNGKNLYALTEGGMLHWTDINFSELTEDEVNIFIAESLKRVAK